MPPQEQSRVSAIVPSPALAEALTTGYLARALEAANLPSLLSVLFQLTGEQTWLQPPYLPSRTRGLEDNDTAGFPSTLQHEVRTAAAAALRDFAAGKPVAVPAPTGETLIRLMSANVGESVPADFEPMLAADMGFRDRSAPKVVGGRPTDFLAVIIGAGVSGIAAAIAFQDAGVPFVILEKNTAVGGTWLENRYPGCGVDTPSYLYSYSFSPKEWTTHFGKRDEVAAYLDDVASRHDIHRSVRFGTEVVGMEWDADSARWIVTARSDDGREETLGANVVITAVGQLNRPKLPHVPGFEQFRGPAFHSACWPEDLDLAGKRVAVVGTGASAMQIVPAIVDEVAELIVFQRSPQWIAPNDNYFKAVSAEVHWLLENVPLYREWYRFRLAWNFNDKIHATLNIDPTWTEPTTINVANEGHRRYLSRYLESELAGRADLIAKATPHYPPFGKRMLLDNGWFRALKQPHVTLVTEGVAQMTENSVISTSEDTYEVDVAVFATGFDAQRLLHPLEIAGLNGTIRDAWGDDDPRAFLGMSTPGFPNLFFLYGPGTNLGHGGSWITMAECQSRYIADLLCTMINDEIPWVECREAIHDAYNRSLDDTHSRMVWSHPAMNSWYRNAAGRVVTNSPWRVADYWQMTETPNLADYRLPTAL